MVLNLHLSKLAATREIVEAAQGDPRAEDVWWAYHEAIEDARGRVADDHLAGLYVDLHGHHHDIERVEVGYLLLDDELRLSDSELDQGTNCQVSRTDTTPISCMEKSSILELTSRSGRSRSELLSGIESLGGQLEVDGVPAVPSDATAAPGSGEEYYNGSFSTIRYLSLIHISEPTRPY